MPASKPHLKSSNQPLTEKELVFVEHYLIFWNPAKAAQKAGYCVDNPFNARVAGCEILSKPYIRHAIDERMITVCMEANEVLARLATIARNDIADYLVQDRETAEWYVDIQKVKDAGLGFLIKSIEPNRFGGHSKVEFYSSADALDRIAKHLNLLKQPETEINVSLSAWSIFVENAKKQQAQLPERQARDLLRTPTQQALTTALRDASGDPDANIQFIDGSFTDTPKDLQPND